MPRCAGRTQVVKVKLVPVQVNKASALSEQRMLQGGGWATGHSSAAHQ